jgi:GPH family glycoside/pentoside/hexuronide:cation symporter
VAGVLTFTTPNLGSGAKLVYAYITYSLLMFIYTAVNIPYSALMGVISPNSQERTKISSIRFIGAFTAGMLVQWCTLPLVKLLGHGTASAPLRCCCFVLPPPKSALLRPRSRIRISSAM